MFYFTPYIIQPLLSAAACGALAAYTLRRGHARASMPVFWIMLILSGWSFAYALNTAALSLPLKIFFYKIGTTLASFAGVSLLALALEVAGFGGWLTRRKLILIAAMPAFSVLLAWTSESHTLFRHSFTLWQNGPLLLLAFKLGPLWYLHLLYVNGFTLAAIFVLLIGAMRSPAGSRARFLLIVLGSVVPLLVENLNLSPIRGFSMITSTFWFSGCCYTLAIFRHRLLEVAPVAREALFDQLDEPILIFDDQGALVDANRAAKKLFSPASDAGLPWLSVAATARFPILRTLSTAAAPLSLDDVVIDHVDDQRYWRIKSLPLVRGGNTVGNLVQLYDISVLKRGEEMLLRAHFAAESANRAKSVFLANMSHEIRTPMNAIIGFTELVLDSGLTGEQRHSLETVKQSAESLLDILNNIMDVSKIEAGKIELETVDLDLRKLVESVIRTFSLQAKQKGLDLTHEINPAVPMLMQGDPVRLKQIILNLAGNAIKFTETGSVEISVRIAEVGAPDGDGAETYRPAAPVSLVFSVQDTGIGIPREKLQAIFSSFTQADSSITRRYGGTGLGLSISRQLVTLMGGELLVDSTEGKGSLFSFTLQFTPSRPILAPARMGDQVQPPLERRKMHILLVEDNATNQALTTRLLEKRGHDVITADNGRAALTVLERERFDVILMDVQMPLMDGFETAHAIRDFHSPVLDHNVPIIALTAHTLAGDRERCLAAGMNGYVSKPIKPEELFAAVEQYAANESASPNAKPNAFSQEDNTHLATTPSVSARAELLKRYSGDTDLVDELLGVFQTEIPMFLQKIGDAIEARDAKLLEMQAHACKGAAGAVGFASAQELARNIEKAAKEGDIDHARSYYHRLGIELRTWSQAE